MKDQKAVVGKVIDYIEQNIENEINLDTISKNIGYSKFYLNRVFTEEAGITIYKYLQNRRLTIAAEKLVKTDKPVTQIAYEAGYDTQQSFSFAFKKVFLCPPKAYRDIGIFMPKQNRISMCCSLMPKQSRISMRHLDMPKQNRTSMYYPYLTQYDKSLAKIKGAAA